MATLLHPLHPLHRSVSAEFGLLHRCYIAPKRCYIGLNLRVNGNKMAKNPDLCERSYCRERWSWVVSASAHLAGGGYRHPWRLRVCEAHVKEYRIPGQTDSVGRFVSISPRQEGVIYAR